MEQALLTVQDELVSIPNIQEPNMDMKLNKNTIRDLRLQRSWSQERLAEEARLNPRTVQRVEADGTASLQTRLKLARALSVAPAELDGEEVQVHTGNGSPASVQLAAPAARPSGWHTDVAAWLGHAAGQHFPLLLLIGVLYLSAAPIYFPLSASNFSWLDYDYLLLGRLEWAGLTASVWLLLAGPWLYCCRHWSRERFRRLASYLLIPAAICVLRVWQQELVVLGLSIALYLGGLGLLAAHLKAQHLRAPARHFFYLMLLSYILLWLIQSRLSTFLLGAWVLLSEGRSVPAPWISLPDYLLRMLSQLVQLLPMVLLILYDMGRTDLSAGKPDHPAAATTVLPDAG